MKISHFAEPKKDIIFLVIKVRIESVVLWPRRSSARLSGYLLTHISLFRFWILSILKWWSLPIFLLINQLRAFSYDFQITTDYEDSRSHHIIDFLTEITFFDSPRAEYANFYLSRASWFIYMSFRSLHSCANRRKYESWWRWLRVGKMAETSLYTAIPTKEWV